MNTLRHILAPIAGIVIYIVMLVLAPFVRSLLQLIYNAADPTDPIEGWGTCIISMFLAVITADAVSMWIAPNKYYISTITVAIVSTAAMIIAMTVGVNFNIIASLIGTTIANIAMIAYTLTNKKLK